MFGLGAPELIFILLLALLIFGPKRLPQIGRTLGKGMAEFRRASTELQRSINLDLEASSGDSSGDEQAKRGWKTPDDLDAARAPAAPPAAGPGVNEAQAPEGEDASPSAATEAEPAEGRTAGQPPAEAEGEPEGKGREKPREPSASES